MRRIAADLIFSGNQSWLKHKVILLDDQSLIVDIVDQASIPTGEYEFFPGLVLPGFVNAHCHLELSHLKDKFSTGTQLLPFLKAVVQNREVDPDYVMQCIHAADAQMQEQGIIAVGDISNKTDTLLCKSRSPIYYHTFIEAFDFLQESKAVEFFESYKKVFDAFGNLPKSMVPHAPYSVSKRLFELINAINAQHSTCVSIHSQECKDEDELFINKSGGFVGFWESFGFSMEAFQATGKESVYYALDNMDPNLPSLFIHNTQTKAKHIRDILNWNQNSFFVTCPNANLFIENQLPDYSQFEDACLCIGTDSLSSNWQLSILEEIKTILKYQSSLNLETVLRWATYNGACALNIADWAGSIEPGKKPGLNWIQNIYQDKEEWKMNSNAIVQKIV